MATCKQRYKEGMLDKTEFEKCKIKARTEKKKLRREYRDEKQEKRRDYNLAKTEAKSKKSLVKVNIDKSGSNNVNVKGTSSSTSDAKAKAAAQAKAKAKSKAKSKIKINPGIRTSFPLHTSPDPNKKRSAYSEGANITRPKSLPKKRKGSDWHQVADDFLKGKLYR